MAVRYSLALRNDRMQKVIDRIDGGTGPGILKIGTAGMGTVLAEITLADPSFGAPASGVITMAGVPRSDTSANATQTAAAAIITNSDGTTVISDLTVGTGGTDIVLNSVSIVSGQVVTITAGTLTHGN